MAKPVGEIIIALDLDPTAYTAGQKKILAGAKEAVGSIDAQWRKLGGNCDAYYAAMVQSAINSYNKIAAAAKTSSAEQFRAQSAMVAQVNALHQKMNANPLYETLGIKSQAAYKAQEAAIMASYNTIKQSGTATADDLVRIERAKNEKLKALTKEMAGEHEMSMAAMMRAVLRFYAAWYVASSAVQLILIPLKTAMQYLSTIETSSLGIAASFMTSGKFVDKFTGKVLEGQEALRTARGLSMSIVKELEYANLQTIATLDELIIAYQTALPVALARGFNVKQVKDFTVAMVQAAGAIGLPMNQMAEEIRSLLTGAITPRNTRIATVLGLRNEDINEYKNNAQGLFDFLMNKLSAYQVAGIEAQNTWAGLWSNTKDIVNQLLGNTFEPLFAVIKYEMQNMIDDVVTLDKTTRTIKWNQSFLDAIKDIKKGIHTALAEMYRVGMLLDIAGGALNKFKMSLYSIGNLAGYGPSVKRFEDAADSYLDYEKRFLASDKALMDMAMREQSFSPTTADIKGAEKVVTALGQILYYRKELQKTNNEYTPNKGDTSGFFETLGIKSVEAIEAQKSAVINAYEEIKKSGTATAQDLINAERTKNEKIKALNDEMLGIKKGTGADKSVKEAESVAKRIAEATRRANVEIEGDNQTQYEKDLIRIASEEEKWRAEKATEVDIAKWKAAEITIAENKMYADTTKEALKEFDAWLKLENDKAKERERIAKELSEKPQKEANEARRMVTFYNDLNNMEAEYRNAKLIWIEKEAALKKSKGAEEVAVAKWVAEQKEKLNREQMDGVATKWDYDKKYVNETIANTGRMLDAAMSCYDKESEEYKRLAEAKKVVQIAELAMTAAKNAQIVASNISVAMSNAGAAVTGASIGVGPTGFATAAAMIALLASVFAMYGIAKGGGSVSVPSVPSYGQNTTVLGGENDQASESIKKSWELMEDTYDMEYEKLTNIHNELKDLNDNITGLVTSIIRTGSVGAIPFEAYDPQAMLNFSKTPLGMILTGDFLTPGAPGLLNKFFEGIFGGGGLAVGAQELWSSSTGIKLGGGRAGDIANGAGVNARSYQEWTTRTTTDVWRKDSYDYNYREQALAQETQNLFNSVFKNISEVLVELSTGLGQDVNKALNYVFSPATINLAGMSTEQISSTLNAYISSVGDTAVQAIFGQVLAGYQELGEGLMETAVRLMVDKEIVLEVLNQTNQAYVGTTANTIAFSEALIKLAGDLETLTDIASTYYDKFFSEEEKHVRLQEQMTTILGALNIALPGTREAYRAIVESLDLTTTSGQTAYVTLLKLAESADTYYSTLEDMAEELTETAKALQAAMSSTNDAISEQISLANTAASAARSAANEYRNIIKSLTDAQESIRGGGLIELTERFEKLFAIAMTGDREALSALPGAADKLLAGSLASSTSALDYARDQGKMLLALEEAKAVSVEGANWQDYQATLLETQVNVLEQIRDELEKENPDLAILTQHSGLLSNIATLLGGQTGHIITGNATQDVIKNLQDLNTAYSIDMLSALVSQETTQATTLEGILLAGDNTVSLLSQLVAMMLSQQANQAAAEAAAALAAQQAAAAAQQAAQERAEREAAQKALAEQQQAAAAAQQAAAAQLAAEQAATRQQLQAEFEAWKAAKMQTIPTGPRYDYDIEYLIAASVLNSMTLDQYIQAKNLGFPGYAAGGIASGPESGYGATLHGTELIVSPRTSYPATVKGGDNVVMIEELRAIKKELAELKKDNQLMVRTSKTTADVLQRVTRDGESMLTEAV